MNSNPKLIAQNFLKQKDFHMWHHWAFGDRVTDVMETEEPGLAMDYLHSMRMEISAGSDWLVKELEQEEEYELCKKIVQHTRELRAEALKMEMDIETQLFNNVSDSTD